MQEAECNFDMEDSRLQARQEQFYEERQTGYTLYFRARLGVSEEEVRLYFENETNSTVQCQIKGCVLRVIFSDSEALQRARNVSSYKIDSGCVLIPLRRASSILSPVTNVVYPNDGSSVSSVEPHEGIDCQTGATTVAFTMNVDCQEHISKYYLKDLISFVNVSRCVIRSTEVSGELLLEYDPFTSHCDVGQIMKKINEFAQKFTSIVVALPQNFDEQNLKYQLESCDALVSFSLVGNFSGSQLYKICCETRCIPKVQQIISELTTVPLVSCTPSADVCGEVGSKLKAEGYHSDATYAMKSESPGTAAVAQTVSAVAPAGVLTPSAAELNSDATPSDTAHKTSTICTAVQAPIASHIGIANSESRPSVGALGCSSNDGRLTASQLPQRSPALTYSTAVVASATVSSATRNYHSADALLERGTSADVNDKKTSVPIDNGTTAGSVRSGVAPDYHTLLIPTDARALQLFKNDLEGRLRENLEKLFPVSDPKFRVEFTYEDTQFKICGNRDSVLKARRLLDELFESSKNTSLLETSRSDGSHSSKSIGKADSEKLHESSKLRDSAAIDRVSADRGNNGLLESSPAGVIEAQWAEGRLKAELNSKIDEPVEQLGAASLERGASDKHRRHNLVDHGERSNSDRLLLQLVRGSVAEQRADVLVNSVNRDLTLSSGSISKSILAKGGQGLQQELKRKYSKGIQEFEFAISDGHNLPCRKVLHVACGYYDGVESEKKFVNAIFECLSYANMLRMKSIAFPAIGAGELGYPPATVVKLLHEAVVTFSGAYPERKLKSVICVVYDERTYDLFNSELARLLSVSGIAGCIRESAV